MQPNTLPQQGWSNTTHDIKPVNVYEEAEQQRLYPRNIATGSMRGTQTVGAGKAKIDGSNNRFLIAGDDGDIQLGNLDDGSVGLLTLDGVRELLKLGTSADDDSYGLTVRDGENTKRLLAGRYPDGSIKIKLSQSGHDVSTATDDQLIWSSDFNMFKIVKTASFTIPALDAAGGAADSSTTVTDTSIDSSTPLAYAAFMVNPAGGYNQLPLFSYNFSAILQYYATTAVEVTAGRVYLRTYQQNYTGMATSAVSVKYYLFKETVV